MDISIVLIEANSQNAETFTNLMNTYFSKYVFIKKVYFNYSHFLEKEIEHDFDWLVFDMDTESSESNLKSLLMVNSDFKHEIILFSSRKSHYHIYRDNIFAFFHKPIILSEIKQVVIDYMKYKMHLQKLNS